MLFCYLPVFRAMLQKNSAHDGDFWVILLVVMLLIQLFRRFHFPEEQAYAKARTRSGLRTALYTVFIVLFLTSLVNFTLSLHRGESRSKRSLQHVPQYLHDLELKDKPNIYLFVYDGLPNPRVFREQNLPLEPVQKLFEHYGYKIYEDTYTIGNESLNSMAMTLNISAEQYQSMSKMQEIYSGNSVVNLFLTGAGYGSYNLLENYFTGTYAITNEDLVTEYFPPKELTAVQSDFFLTLLRGVFQGEFRFDTKGIMVADQYTEADRQNRKHELIRDGNSPKFVIDQVSSQVIRKTPGNAFPTKQNYGSSAMSKLLSIWSAIWRPWRSMIPRLSQFSSEIMDHPFWGIVTFFRTGSWRISPPNSCGTESELWRRSDGLIPSELRNMTRISPYIKICFL